MTTKKPESKVKRKQIIEEIDELLKGNLYSMDTVSWNPFRNDRKDDVDRRFFVDHVRLNDRGEVTQHPYTMTMEKMRDLIQWCDDNNYEFYLTGRSEYYPGRTFQIIFKKKEAAIQTPG
ncbi:MAG: hypothetical protein ISF22_10585 [Methanomassiliicoccus sp.]|nr:hypothetical protein [Methanomassiliicoccus sp.]